MAALRAAHEQEYMKSLISGPPEGLLIDLTDEETVPFPQQLITAEVDDTFGLFSSACSKSRSHSAPVIGTGEPIGHDVFSPVFLARACESAEDDSVFKEPSQRSSTPVVCKDRKQKRYQAVNFGSEQILAAADISKLGLNDGFIRGEDTIMSTESSIINTSSASGLNRLNVSGDTTYVSPITLVNSDSDTSSNAGITSTVMDESKLFDLEDFNLTTGSIFKPYVPTTQQTIDAKVDDVIAKVFERRKSQARKHVDDEISRKVQEMFDAASPSKNPHLYSSGYVQSRRSYTPARAVISHEPFSYGTPRRLQVQTSDVQQDVMDTTMTPIVKVGPQLSNIVETGKTEKCVVPTDCGSREIIPGNSVGPATPSALREFNHNQFKTPTRLLFSSSSSSDGDSAKSLKHAAGDSELKVPLIKPIGYSLPRLRQVQPLKAPAQPMKAVHPTVKLAKPEEATKPAKFYGTASAPVHRKFVAPIASSSPIVTPPRNKPRTVVKSSGYGQFRALPLPSGLGTTQSRILPPSTKQHGPDPDLHQSTGPAIKRRSFSVGDHAKPTTASSTLAPKKFIQKENAARFGKK